MVKIMLIEDHPLIRAGIYASLERDPELKIVAEFANGQQAYAQIFNVRPDVVITDVNVPGKNGIQIAWEISSDEKLSNVKSIILTGYHSEQQIFYAMQAGAHGYASKDILGEILLNTIWSVVNGKYVVNGQILSSTSKYCRIREYALSKDLDTKLYKPLTKRENEVLHCIICGMSNEDISRHLGIKMRTVRAHLSNAFLKLDVHDRTQAVVSIIERGWVYLDDIDSLS